MSSNRLNAADKDLEKFIKFLALKSTQVVVQSRLGEKIQTQCNPLASGSDWFNIVIQDHPDVYAETKTALNLVQGESILQRLPISIEISLKTVEGDQMILEVWSIDLQQTVQQQQRMQQVNEKGETKATDAEHGGCVSNNQKAAAGCSSVSSEYTLKAAHAIYNRMGILLKSLISLTRATPAYKLSRRQSPDTYGIYYRIYVDKPQTHMLGEGYKNIKIGQLNTIVGMLSMSVAYRTKMTITPSQQPDNDGTIMLKSDHFRRDATPKHQGAARFHHIKKAAERKVIDIEKPLRPGAFTDVTKLKQYTEDDFILPETPPFDWLLKRTRHESSGGSSLGSASLESLNRKSASPTSPLSNGYQHNINNNSQGSVGNQNNNNNNTGPAINNNVVAFKNLENDENSSRSITASQSPPTKSLLLPVATTPAISNTNIPRSRQSSVSNLAPCDEDNLLKELNFPFASPSSHVNDLAKFYRDCYHAPPLLGLTVPGEGAGSSCSAAANTTTQDAAFDDLSKQLELFETSLEDYDKLVSQLTLTTSSSTESRSSGLQMSN